MSTYSDILIYWITGNMEMAPCGATINMASRY